MRVLFRFLRVPVLEVPEYGLCRFGLDVAQNRVMQLSGRTETLQSQLFLSFRIPAFFCDNPQEILRIVTQEVAYGSGCPFYLLRHLEHRGPFPLRIFGNVHQGFEPFQGPILFDVHRQRDFGVAPSGRCDFATFRHHIVIMHQRLQDHRSTSSPATCITPCFRRARKYIGCGLAGFV